MESTESAAPDGTSTGTEPERVPLSVPAAAQTLGIKERAVRKRIAAGTLEAFREGGRWLVYLPAPNGTGTGTIQDRFTAPGVPQTGTTAPNGTRPAPSTDLAPLLEELRELRRRNEELAGQVGFWQGRYQEAQDTIKLLQAPATETEPERRSWWRRLFGSER